MEKLLFSMAGIMIFLSQKEQIISRQFTNIVEKKSIIADSDSSD